MTASDPARFPVGTFRPEPGRGSLGRMLLTQSGLELRLALRNGEQLLLTLLIPITLLVGLTVVELVPLPEPRVNYVVPAVLALAVMSTAFTGQAISARLRPQVRRDHQAGRHRAAPLAAGGRPAGRGARRARDPDRRARGDRAGARLGSRGRRAGMGAAAHRAGQLPPSVAWASSWAARCARRWCSRWRTWCGSCCCSPGGSWYRSTGCPPVLGTIAGYLPSGALAEGLRTALIVGTAPALRDVLVLLGWTAVAGLLAMRTVRLR